MIGYLRGKVLDKQPPWLLLDVGGVGYELEASMNTFYALSSEVGEVALFVHMVVREDAQLLYGFKTSEERELFRTLLKVNGVGPRVALAILSTFAAPEFIACVQAEDVTALVRVPGIGKKTAERILVDIKDRLPSFDVAEPSTESGGVVGGAVVAGSARQDAISALVALGFRAPDASKAVRSVPDANEQDSETLIRAALKALSNK